MILKITHINIQEKNHDDKQRSNNKNNIQENTKCIEYDYQVNALVFVYYIKTHDYDAPYKGPYKIIQTWTSVK